MGMIPERVFVRVVRPVTVSLMFGCLALSFVQLLRLLLPGWHGEYVAFICVLAALEANYSYQFLRGRSRLLYPVVRYRLIELLLLYFVVQAGATIASGDVLRLIGAVEVDNERIAAFTLVILCWLGATDTARDLYDIGEPVYQSPMYRPPADRLVGRFFTGGAILLAVTGLAQLGTQALTDLAHPPVSGLVLDVLIYFFLGTVMLGQIRYAALWYKWEREGAMVPENLGSRWLRYSAGFLGLMAFVAFLLPTSYTIGLLDILRYGLQAVSAIVEALSLLFFLPIGWLLLHLGIHPAHAPSPHFPTLHPTASPSNRSTGVDLLALLRSAMFWLVLLGVLGFLVRGYVGGQGKVRRGAGLWEPFFRIMRSLLRAIKSRARRYAGVLLESMPWAHGSQASEAAVPLRATRWRFSRMSARERVLYYYLSALQRAGKQGLGRRDQETPREYEETLSPRLPLVGGEMRSLTEAFVEARYGRRDVSSDRASEAHALWRRVKQALQTAQRKVWNVREDSSRDG